MPSGVRLQTYLARDVRTWRLLQWLILKLCVFVASFVATDYLVFVNADLHHPDLCHSMQLLGMVLFLFEKLVVEFFLLERARMARAKTGASRWRDWAWVAPASLLATSGVILIVLTALDLHYPDESCHFTLSFVIVVVLFVYSVAVAVALTALFVCLLQRSKRSLQATSHWNNVEAADPKGTAQTSSTSHLDASPTSFDAPRHNLQYRRAMIDLQKRTIIAAAILHIPTIIMFVVLLSNHNSVPLWAIDLLSVVDSTFHLTFDAPLPLLINMTVTWELSIMFWLTSHGDR